MTEKEKIIVSSGNVFEDLGLPEPNDRLLKSQLARQIGLMIEQRGLTQKQAAEAMGIDQPKVSAILRGQLSSFTIDRLVKYLNAFDIEVSGFTFTEKKRELRAV